MYIYSQAPYTSTIHFSHSVWFWKSSSLAVPKRGSLCYVAHAVLHPFSELAILSLFSFPPPLFPQLLMVSICTCSVCLLILFCIMNLIAIKQQPTSPSHIRLQLALYIFAFILFRPFPSLRV